MISVVLYGRNDSHGYNLHKRAAISFNCIAEVLTHPDDEIIFVDCNTPDELPTFPETIHDTLTPRAKELLRILRLRPALYEKHKRNSTRAASEPLCRNVAIRRSNPKNRWILSTNTDLIFVPRVSNRSLSDIVADLPDGFYENPRFDMPEGLWESLDRSNPKEIMTYCQRWGRTLHLNEVMHNISYFKFDGPGDFQLMLRKQIFDILGFNEAMILPWHLDSNLCKRFYLLNGKVDSLMDQLFAYHCYHNRQGTALHAASSKENDLKRFVFNVESPDLPEQAESWGIPNEVIEEIRLSDTGSKRFLEILKQLLPPLKELHTEDHSLAAFFDGRQTFERYPHGHLYDNARSFPFLADHLITISPHATIAYFGGNDELLKWMGEFREKCGHQGLVLYDKTLFDLAYASQKTLQKTPPFPSNCMATRVEELFEESQLIIFDASLKSFPQVANSHGITAPKPSEELEHYAQQWLKTFLSAVAQEKGRMLTQKTASRKFIAIGVHTTMFNDYVTGAIGLVRTPYGVRVQLGYVRDDLEVTVSPGGDSVVLQSQGAWQPS